MNTIQNHGVTENGDAATSPQNEIPETLDPEAPMAWRDGNEIVFSRLGDDHVFRISEQELRCLIAGLDQTESPSEQEHGQRKETSMNILTEPINPEEVWGDSHKALRDGRNVADLSISSDVFVAFYQACKIIAETTEWNKKTRIVLEYDPGQKKMELIVVKQDAPSEGQPATGK